MRGQGKIQLLVTSDKHIVILGRKYRSKWWRVKCTCPKSRRRKDKTCKHEREIFETLIPGIKKRASIDVSV